MSNGLVCGADVVHYYSFFFAVDDWVQSAACRSLSVYFAVAVLSFVEDAVALFVLQLGVSLSIDTDELFGVISRFLEDLDVFLRKEHLGLFAAYSASCTAHGSVCCGFSNLGFACLSADDQVKV